jgi:hypothetical protein
MDGETASRSISYSIVVRMDSVARPQLDQQLNRDQCDFGAGQCGEGSIRVELLLAAISFWAEAMIANGSMGLLT